MSHPCDGHACDHCYLCDVVGVCCASAPPNTSGPVNGSDRIEALHSAVVEAATAHPCLPVLIAADRAVGEFRSPSDLLQLPVGSSLRDELIGASPEPTELEVQHVLASRHHQR